MSFLKRSTVLLSAAALASVGLSTFAVAPASAAVLGSVTVNPLSGTDSTLFGGSVNAACPAGTGDSFFDIVGNDIGPGNTAGGTQDLGFLGAGSPEGTGPQSFAGASIANLKTTNAGSFASSGAYTIRFNCVSSVDGSVSDTYETTMNYVAGGAGAWTIAVPARATATTLAASPAGPFELGTTTDLTADVTPTSGPDDATGSIEFFNGTTSLGVDNTLTPTGVATLAGVSLPQGSNSLTAVYTPASSTFTGSTSPAVVVEVTPVAARPTTAVLTVDPVSGPAYQVTTLTCAVSATTGQPNGTATFRDGTAVVGSAPVSNGAPAVFSSSSFAPGDHSFVCDFVGTAPYSNSTSNTVSASYVAPAVTPAQANVTVSIPQGALTITTPYTPENPLALGVAVLDAADSTYSANAPISGISITDTRAGNLGWTASVVAGSFTNGTASFGGDRAGLYGLTATPVAGNALNAGAISFTNTAPAAPGLGVVRQFASYPSGQPLGTASISGTFGVDQVPTSVAPGTYTSVVTFTAA